jgi:hypothetical protein
MNTVIEAARTLQPELFEAWAITDLLLPAEFLLFLFV